MTKMLSVFKSYKSDESGSFIIFSLFLFVLIMMVGGMGVDFMRHEQKRVALQNTLDSAIIAASSLDQDLEAEALVRNYVAKAGFDSSDVQVASSQGGIGSNTTTRTVTATSSFKVDTLMMGFMDIDELHGVTGGTAAEAIQEIEIALVLDSSGSMRSNQKIDNLKTAAKNFVDTVISKAGSANISISIVPYNHQVSISDDLFARLDTEGGTANVNGPPTHSGAISSYSTSNPQSRCAVFDSTDFQTRNLTSSSNGQATKVEMSAVFVDDTFSHYLNGVDNTPYHNPLERTFWCNTFFPSILLFESDQTTINNYIDSLVALEGTAIDYGMNWGTAILDPSFRPVITGMVDDGLLPETQRGHPTNYGRGDIQKYIVLMTDGINTTHRDLKDEFKSGPTRVWYSESLANGTEFNGYLVEMPANDSSARWYTPGDPYTNSDDAYLAEADLPTDAQQWDMQRLFKRFRQGDIASYLFSQDYTRQAEFYDAERDTGSHGTADVNLNAVCDQAVANDDITVFTVAFEAPEEANTILRNCASTPGHHFDAAGTQISDAFNSIATQISVLKLTQ